MTQLVDKDDAREFATEYAAYLADRLAEEYCDLVEVGQWLADGDAPTCCF